MNEELLSWPSGTVFELASRPRQCKHLGQVPITKQLSFQNLHQIFPLGRNDMCHVKEPYGGPEGSHMQIKNVAAN